VPPQNSRDVFAAVYQVMTCISTPHVNSGGCKPFVLGARRLIHHSNSSSPLAKEVRLPFACRQRITRSKQRR
jgi:hypothetical protein